MGVAYAPDKRRAAGRRIGYSGINTFPGAPEPNPGRAPERYSKGMDPTAMSKSGNQPGAIYVFDLSVPGGTWGAAMGRPVRDWAIVDLVPEGAWPLAGKWR